MTLCFLVRHARHCGRPDRLTGRLNPPLSTEGQAEAERLARAFKAAQLTHVLSSPERRALETASAIARASNLQVELAYALDEIDYGAWTGRALSDLGTEPDYLDWIHHRSAATPPGGETMREVQTRVVATLFSFAKRFPRGRAAMVSHAEPIRAAELFCRGLGPDHWHDIDIPIASVTTLAIGTSGQMIISKAAA